MNLDDTVRSTDKGTAHWYVPTLVVCVQHDQSTIYTDLTEKVKVLFLFSFWKLRPLDVSTTQ